MSVNGSERVGGVVGARRADGLEPAGAEAVARRFARAMLAREPGAAAACFAAGGRILTADGTEVTGREEVRGVLAQITSSDHALEIRSGRIVVAEGVASCTQFWRRSTDGGAHEQRSVVRLVLARGAGRWAIAIAWPWE
jgi:hypothetical protein